GDARSAGARADLRHADRGSAARLSGADRLWLARRGAARPHARERTHAHRLDAPAAHAGTTAVRRRRRTLSRPLVSGSAPGAGSCGTTRLVVRGDPRVRAARLASDRARGSVAPAQGTRSPAAA